MDEFSFDDDFFSFLDFGSDEKTASTSKKETSNDNGFFGFIDSIGGSTTKFLGNILDSVEDSKVADGFMQNFFDKKSVEKKTDETPVNPDSRLSGFTQQFKDIPTTYLVGGGLATLLLVAIVIKKA